MPNIASILKSEIARVARKEVRAEISSLNKAASSHRADIAALKRRTQALEQALRLLRKTAPESAPRPGPGYESGAKPIRFSAKGLASQRQRLELSGDELGRLIGTSGQSIYNWEAGKSRPRDRHIPAIAALKTLGKKQAVAHLASQSKAR